MSKKQKITTTASDDAPATKKTPLVAVKVSAEAIHRHIDALGAKCHHWTPEVALALDVAQDAVNHMAATITALPDDFVPPRRQGGGEPIGVGALVVFKKRVIDDYAGLLDFTQDLRITKNNGKMFEVTDAENKSIWVIGTHLKAA